MPQPTEKEVGSIDLHKWVDRAMYTLPPFDAHERQDTIVTNAVRQAARNLTAVTGKLPKLIEKYEYPERGLEYALASLTPPKKGVLLEEKPWDDFNKKIKGVNNMQFNTDMKNTLTTFVKNGDRFYPSMCKLGRFKNTLSQGVLGSIKEDLKDLREWACHFEGILKQFSSTVTIYVSRCKDGSTKNISVRIEDDEIKIRVGADLMTKSCINLLNEGDIRGFVEILNHTKDQVQACQDILNQEYTPGSFENE